MRKSAWMVQGKMERKMLVILLQDRKTNEWIRWNTKVINIAERVARLKWKWAGNLMRTDDCRWTRKITEQLKITQDDREQGVKMTFRNWWIPNVWVKLPTANGDELKRLMSGDGRKAAEDDLPNLLTVTFQGAVSSQSVKRVCVWMATSKKFG